MAVLELDFKILMCHDNKIENTFNINGERCDPFHIYFAAVGFFMLQGNLGKENVSPPQVLNLILYCLGKTKPDPSKCICTLSSQPSIAVLPSPGSSPDLRGGISWARSWGQQGHNPHSAPALREGPGWSQGHSPEGLSWGKQGGTFSPIGFLPPEQGDGPEQG